MSEEDAFLDGLAADRADRTRLLVFADWLADRGDPREEFVRLHTKLLDMDGTEPEFAEHERLWATWTDTPVRLDCMPQASGRLSERWLDAICRFCTEETIAPNLGDADFAWWSTVERIEHQFESIHPYDTVVLYHGQTQGFETPLEFLAGTVLIDIGNNEWFRGEPVPCPPITKGKFWRLWQEQISALRQPIPLPTIAPDNHFLGAQYFDGGWAFWAAVAIYEHDYFALFWTTTD